MIQEDGTISFLPELMATVDDFIARYEAVKGPLQNDVERGLVISYALGTLRAELDALWETLGQEPCFGALPPRQVYERYVAQEVAATVEDQGSMVEELRKRGWFHS